MPVLIATSMMMWPEEKWSGNIRAFHTREAPTLITLFKALILPIVEYCCQPWRPTNIGQMRKLEGVERTHTSRIKELNNMDGLLAETGTSGNVLNGKTKRKIRI